jgi:TRAP transporter 4TM/12TM fusion protein
MTADARKTLSVFTQALAAVVPIIAIAWIMAVPRRLGLLVYPEQVAALLLGLALAVVFLREPAPDRPRAPAVLAIDTLLGFAAIGLGIWVYIRFPILSEGSFLRPNEALAVGLVTVALVMEGLRRAIGWALVVIFAVLLLYALFGDLVPGALTGRPQPLGDLVRFLGTDSTATWGQALQIAAFVVIVFVLFGGLLLAVGGGDFFTQLSMRVSGKGPGNTAKVAVTASALFGSISGSAVSNVMSTGVMTIPLMRRAGFRPAQAGAIEAVASTGGQLMPPIMGAAAFLMAEILQVPYRDIVLAALLPAVLYFLSLYVQIHFIAHRDRIPSLQDFERTPILRVLANGWLPLLSIAVLLLAIFVARIRAELAAVWAIGAIVAIGLAVAPFTHGAHRLTPSRLLEGIVRAGKSTCDILLITAAAGMIIGLLSTTGLGFALSLYLLDFGGESLFALLVVTACVGVVLGMGLPTSGVYLLMASLAAPALTQLGIAPMQAHMFVFYYGMLSMITPPIAMASFAAASIAGAPQIRTSLEGFRFGWIAYVLPFLFIYKPGLLMTGAAIDIAYVFVSSAAALVLVTGGLVGHALKPLGLAARVSWTALGLAMIAPIHEFGGWTVEYAVTAAGILLLLAYAYLTRGGTAPAKAHQEEIAMRRSGG